MLQYEQSERLLVLQLKILILDLLLYDFLEQNNPSYFLPDISGLMP